MIALGPDAETASRLASPYGVNPASLHLTLIHVPVSEESVAPNHLTRMEELAQAMAASLPPATGTVSGETVFQGGDVPVHVALISVPGLSMRRAELVARAKALGVPLSENFDFLPHVSRQFPAGALPKPPDVSGQPVRFDHLIVAKGEHPDDWIRLPLQAVQKWGAFNPDLHPHGWHGYWAATGGRKPQEIGSKGNRQRSRLGANTTYARGPAGRQRQAPMLPGRDHRAGFGARGANLPAHTAAAPKAGSKMMIQQGQGAAKTNVQATVQNVQTTATHHVVTLQTPNGVRVARIPHASTVGKPIHDTLPKVHARASRSANWRVKPSGYVNHQTIASWWSQRRSRLTGLLPYSPEYAKPGRGALGRSRPGHFKKDAMTVTEDLGHEGQSPVSIQQGGSTLQRCPKCGFKLAMDGHCPVHGNVLKAFGEDPRVPSTGGAMPGPTIHLPKSRRGNRPLPNDPVGPMTCPDCGGTDGYHTPTCPRLVLDPGLQPTTLGA